MQLTDLGTDEPAKVPMRTCPECREGVPLKDDACPGCGYTFVKKRTAKKGPEGPQIWLDRIFALAGAGFIAFGSPMLVFSSRAILRDGYSAIAAFVVLAQLVLVCGGCLLFYRGHYSRTKTAAALNLALSIALAAWFTFSLFKAEMKAQADAKEKQDRPFSQQRIMDPLLPGDH